MRISIALPLAAAIALCAGTGLAARDPARLSASQQRGKDFAQAHCSACHAIVPGQLSPNPESPPFEAVVNTTGVTARTLGQFLRDSHNFPGAMAFKIQRSKVNDLAAYMVTLKRKDYHPDIQ